jgi:hypothetical protein
VAKAVIWSVVNEPEKPGMFGTPLVIALAISAVVKPEGAPFGWQLAQY